MNPNDLAFDSAEALYRTISTDQLLKSTGKVKPSALRPQFSVSRSKYARTPDEVPTHGKFNGVAEISVAQVRGIRGEHLTPHCVYEPVNENIAHSLIALVTEALPTVALDADYERIRALIADAMTVRKAPA